VLQRAKERNILQAIKRRKDNWMGFILHRNCLLKHVEGRIEGRIEMMGRRRRRRRRRRRKLLLDDLRKRKDTVN
jgi:hypothetical protein